MTAGKVATMHDANGAGNLLGRATRRIYPSKRHPLHGG